MNLQFTDFKYCDYEVTELPLGGIFWVPMGLKKEK